MSGPQESYVHEKVMRRDISFYPLNRSLDYDQALAREKTQDLQRMGALRGTAALCFWGRVGAPTPPAFWHPRTRPTPSPQGLCSHQGEEEYDSSNL